MDVEMNMDLPQSSTVAGSVDAAVNKKIEVIPTSQQSTGGAGMDKRMAVHSHIRGLGLNEQGEALDEEGTSSMSSGGFIGQGEAREAAGIIVDMVQSKKMAGRGVLIVGGPGTGKTALAVAMAQELGSKVPFTAMVGSQVFSAEVKKTEILMEHFRRSIGLRVKEIKEVYEGEVTILNPVETENPLSGYGKTISHVLVGLKSCKGSKTLKLDPSLLANIQKEGIRVGDVIYIESGTGSVKRVGRSDAFRHEVDLEAELYVPLPKGEVYKKKEISQEVTLHDLDAANAQPGQQAGTSDLLGNLLSQLQKGGKQSTEMTDKLRNEINKVVSRYVETGQGELVPGVLFIDEVHMLDLECFAFLNRALESPFSPIVVLATNRGMCPIRGSGSQPNGNDEVVNAHGLPSDLLDRLVILRTKPYTEQERKRIIGIRAKMENVSFADESSSLAYLADLSGPNLSGSLRYALQLLSPCKMLANIYGRDKVTLEDVYAARDLFLDAKTASSLIK